MRIHFPPSRPRTLGLAILACAALAGCRYRGPVYPTPKPEVRPDRFDDRGIIPLPAKQWAGYTDIQQVTFSRNGEDNDPCISRDGKWLLYSSTAHSMVSSIYLRPIEGKATRQLTTGFHNDMYPVFDPTGTKVAFASQRTGNWDVFVVETANPATAWQVTQSPGDDIHPSWSPDGRYLAYCARARDEDWQLWLVDVKTHGFTNLGPGMYPEWSPAGDLILFQKPRFRSGGWFGVWTIKPDGSAVTEIVSSEKWAAINPTWSPDGKHIAFASVNKSPEAQAESRAWAGDDIWIVNADGSGLYQLTTDEGPEWNPTWSVDGRIYFVSRRDGTQNIYSVRPTLSELALTPEPGK